MTEKRVMQTYPTAFKLAAIRRLEAGELVWPLARELGLSRKLLHDWRKAFQTLGPAGLNRKRGPKPGPRAVKAPPDPAPPGSSGELAQALARVAELERALGRKQVENDFFQHALRALNGPATQGATPPRSAPSSKP
jgi:transposase